MSQSTLQVTIVNASGRRLRYQAERIEFDFGPGSIEILPGRPPFCRRFERGVMTLNAGNTVTTFNMIIGIASLMGHDMSVVCRRWFVAQPEESLSPDGDLCSAQTSATVGCAATARGAS